MDSLFGSEKQETRSSGGGTAEALNQLRLTLATQLASGTIPPMMQGYLDKVLIPSTMNAATASGLGRSGAVQEAVANAIFGQGMGFLQALLTGVPGGRDQTVTTRKEPGIFDWISLAKPVGESLSWLDKLFGGTERSNVPEIP